MQTWYSSYTRLGSLSISRSRTHTVAGQHGRSLACPANADTFIFQKPRADRPMIQQDDGTPEGLSMGWPIGHGPWWWFTRTVVVHCFPMAMIGWLVHVGRWVPDPPDVSGCRSASGLLLSTIIYSGFLERTNWPVDSHEFCVPTDPLDITMLEHQSLDQCTVPTNWWIDGPRIVPATTASSALTGVKSLPCPLSFWPCP